MKWAVRLLKMLALVYVLVSLAFGMIAWMLSGGSLWQFVLMAVQWPAIVWK